MSSHAYVTLAAVYVELQHTLIHTTQCVQEVERVRNENETRLNAEGFKGQERQHA